MLRQWVVLNEKNKEISAHYRFFTKCWIQKVDVGTLYKLISFDKIYVWYDCSCIQGQKCGELGCHCYSPQARFKTYLISISFFFLCSGIILSQDIVKRPSLSSAPLTFTSSAIVNDLANCL